MDAKEELAHIAQVSQCINYIKSRRGWTKESEIQTALFLAQYQFDVPNLRIIKYMRGGKPVIADDWVIKTFPYSELVHRAYILSAIVQHDQCTISRVPSVLASISRDMVYSILEVLSVLFGMAPGDMVGKKFEDLAKQAGFEIVEVEAP